MLVVEFCFGAVSSLLFKNLYHLSTVLSTKYTSIPQMSEWLVHVIKYTTVIFRIEGFELAVHASGFLVTRGTSHRGVGLQTSLLSWSQHVFTYCCLTDWLWDFVMSGFLPPVALQTHTEFLSSFSFLSIAFWVMKDKANKSDEERRHYDWYCKCRIWLPGSALWVLFNICLWMCIWMFHIWMMYLFLTMFTSQLLALGLSDCAWRMGIFFQVRFVVLDQIGHNVGRHFVK